MTSLWPIKDLFVLALCVIPRGLHAPYFNLTFTLPLALALASTAKARRSRALATGTAMPAQELGVL